MAFQKIVSLHLYWLIACMLLAGFLPARGQVVNDSIAHRLQLSLNQPLQSSTAHATVEWACVDEQLTGRCIEYHNDQWFYFTAANIPVHYLRISAQDCRDIRGVQMVLLSGEPCQPETYQVLACISLASQEDVYLKVDTLEAGKTYLLNIDGYLHDFCSFTIMYADTPAGIGQDEGLRHPLQVRQQAGVVLFSWEVPAEWAGDIRQFELYRREAREKRFQQQEVLPHERNAFGRSQKSYNTTDSLAEAGRYFYKLLARLENGESLVLAQKEIKLKASSPAAEVLEVKLPFKRKTPYTVLLFDAGTQKLLERKKGISSKKQQSLRLAVSQWRQQGIRLFRLVLINEQTGEQKEWLFSR